MQMLRSAQHDSVFFHSFILWSVSLRDNQKPQTANPTVSAMRFWHPSSCLCTSHTVPLARIKRLFTEWGCPMWFRNEFRARIIEPGKIVEFVPTDQNGNKRTGVTVRLHDEKAAKVARSWLATDRVFFYHELEEDRIDSGFFNSRTKERILI
jgi:hypothetical protein